MSKEHVNMVGQEIGGLKGNFKPKKNAFIKVVIAAILIAILTAIILN